ncbi:hypothetical protein OF846_005047 [Rhodotorula toruloides]|nr:hypothetical protein OF846_005047 [Rhodotorula toruloides]
MRRSLVSRLNLLYRPLLGSTMPYAYTSLRRSGAERLKALHSPPHPRLLLIAIPLLFCFFVSMRCSDGQGDLATVQAGYEGMLRAVLRNPVATTSSWKDQLVHGQRYIISSAFGGQSNQFIIKHNLLYMAKHTNRTAVLPPFTAVHFDAAYRSTDEIFDLPRFYHLTGIRAVPLHRFKTANDTSSVIDHLSCWALRHQARGPKHLPPDTNKFWRDYGFSLEYWMPYPFKKLGIGYDFAGITAFLKNRTQQLEWVREVQRQLLPQIESKDGAPSPSPSIDTIAPFYDPLHGIPPTDDDQVECVDAIFYTSEFLVPRPPPVSARAMPIYTQSWEEVGQYLHFVPELEAIADVYLMRLFAVSRPQDIPPFITVHIRRGDFSQAAPTSIIPAEGYIRALNEVRARLQDRLDKPLTEDERHGRPVLQRFALTPSDYPVVFTTDAAVEVRQELELHGWKTIDHREYKTTATYGEWHPALIDSIILARGQAIVGTPFSTYSMLSGWRIESWHGGIFATADAIPETRKGDAH